jgi:Cryptococcal mannosyltransferase 1
MPFLNTRIRRLLTRVAILAVFAVLIDTSWVFYRVNRTISAAGQSDSGIELANKGEDGKQKQRIFISSTHWNNEAILRSHWNPALVQLVKSLGPENVYVSIIESGSWDGTKSALHDLDDALGQLGVKRSISMSETTHADEILKVPKDKGNEGEEKEEEDGWIDTSRGRKELRRIPFLSRQRNDSLKPLAALEKKFRMKFDKILFLNDVVFTVSPSPFAMSWVIPQ